MIPFHSVLPEVAEREVRCVHIRPAPGTPLGPGLPAGEYAFVEFYCEDPSCDCRRVFIEVIARHRPDTVLASINYGWESESFYRDRMSWDADAPREVVAGSLDPINAQSEHSRELLELFQRHVLDEPYRLRLRRHFELFREELRRREAPATTAPGDQAEPAAAPLRSGPDDARIPAAHRERFREVAALLQEFGQRHLDAELTGFTLELWRRVCRRKSSDCLRGWPGVWAASVVHVIARMNFLFDRAQPVHLVFGTICDYFQANKNTVTAKATGIERLLRLQSHHEPGLCRREFMEAFTTVRLSNGVVLSWKAARMMGYLPPQARPEDLF